MGIFKRQAIGKLRSTRGGVEKVEHAAGVLGWSNGRTITVTTAGDFPELGIGTGGLLVLTDAHHFPTEDRINGAARDEQDGTRGNGVDGFHYGGGRR